MSRTYPRIIKFIRFFEKHSSIITTICTGILALVDIFDLSDYKNIIYNHQKQEFHFPTGFITTIIVTVVGVFSGITSVRSSKDIEKLESENDKNSKEIIKLAEESKSSKKDMYELFNSYLRVFSQNLGLKGRERISVYKIELDFFILIGRYSDNPELCKKGRNNYPINEGFISKAWQFGEFFVNNLPKPFPSATEYKQYKNEINKYCKIDPKILDKMKMKSRSYYIRRIDGFDGSPKAVLVIESQEPNLDKSQIDKIFNKDVQTLLITFVDKLNFSHSETLNNFGL